MTLPACCRRLQWGAAPPPIPQPLVAAGAGATAAQRPRQAPLEARPPPADRRCPPRPSPRRLASPRPWPAALPPAARHVVVARWDGLLARLPEPLGRAFGWPGRLHAHLWPCRPAHCLAGLPPPPPYPPTAALPSPRPPAACRRASRWCASTHWPRRPSTSGMTARRASPSRCGGAAKTAGRCGSRRRCRAVGRGARAGPQHLLCSADVDGCFREGKEGCPASPSLSCCCWHRQPAAAQLPSPASRTARPRWYGPLSSPPACLDPPPTVPGHLHRAPCSTRCAPRPRCCRSPSPGGPWWDNGAAQRAR